MTSLSPFAMDRSVVPHAADHTASGCILDFVNPIHDLPPCGEREAFGGTEAFNSIRISIAVAAQLAMAGEPLRHYPEGWRRFEGCTDKGASLQ